MKDARSSQAGTLNNLTLELQLDGSETFHLFSSHSVKQADIRSTERPRQLPPSLKQPSASPSKHGSASTTPSPQKTDRRAKLQLEEWCVRLCQRIESMQVAEDDAGVGDSETESESDANFGDTREDGPVRVQTAWYVAKTGIQDAQTLCQEVQRDHWHQLEGDIRDAWDRGAIDVLGRAEDQLEDGTYSVVRLDFHLDPRCDEDRVSTGKRTKPYVKEVKSEQDSSTDKVASLSLQRLDDSDLSSLREASTVAIQLMKAFGSLRVRARSLVEERDSHRKLLHNTRKHERFKESSTSLVNPGRIKRKTHDDEGFEED